MQRKNPKTALDAYKSMTNEILVGHYAEIVKALKYLGKANYEMIATFLNWSDKNRVSRRLKEMEGLQIVFKNGETLPTSSGRAANVYELSYDWVNSKPQLLFKKK